VIDLILKEWILLGLRLAIESLFLKIQNCVVLLYYYSICNLPRKIEICFSYFVGGLKAAKARFGAVW
jgi:hypothetical protein